MAEYKTIEEIVNIIEEETYREIKSRIDESLSRNLYHFCSLDAAVNILKEGRFRLSHVDRNGTERDIATKISNREKAVYPYSKVVNAEEDLPQKEKDGTIYKVKFPDYYPENSCFQFSNGKWQYLQGSENHGKHISGLRTGKVTQTELPDGRISYANDSKELYGEYYMCFSRVPGAFDGYSGRMSLNKWKGTYVRFSVNGDLLNTRYKGGPVNFYTNSNRVNDKLKDLPLNKAVKGKSSLEKQKSQTTREYGDKFAGEIDRIKIYEHEDRVFSNDQFIPPKMTKTRDGQVVKNPQNLFSSGIVERIDIFVNNSILSKSDGDSEIILSQIGDLLKRSKQYGILKKIRIYNTEAGLSLLPIQKAYEKLSPYLKKKFYDTFKSYMYITTNDFLERNKDVLGSKVKEVYSESDINLIAKAIEFICFGHSLDEKGLLSSAKALIKDYGFGNIEAKILDRIKPLDYYRTEVKKDGYFSMQFMIIKGQINNLQGWKIPKIGRKLWSMLEDYASNMHLQKLGSIVSFKKKLWKHFINGGSYAPLNKLEQKALDVCMAALDGHRDRIVRELSDEINEIFEDLGIQPKVGLKKVIKNWKHIIRVFFDDMIDYDDRSLGGLDEKYFNNIIKDKYFEEYVVDDTEARDIFLSAIHQVLRQ